MTVIDINQVIKIAQQAGQIILAVYNESRFEVQNKADNSALTQADLESHDYICSALSTLFPNIPIISEESAVHHDYEIRKNWDYFFLVDPLDGTKEFIKKNGEFTVNIALIHKNQPVLGVIHAPVLNVTYFAEKNKGAFKRENNNVRRLSTMKTLSDNVRVVMSRSHCCVDTQAFVDEIASTGKYITAISAGSALKFGLIAEGKADIYPRFSPTMEWDTAAGHILVNETGKKLTLVDKESDLHYNKQVLVNPGFLVQ